MVTRFNSGGSGWRLRGSSRRIAYGATAAFIAVTVAVTLINHWVKRPWDWTLLQAWSLVPHAVATTGLLIVGTVRRSVTFWALGTLLGLVFIEEAFHVLNPLADLLVGMARHLEASTEIDPGGMGIVLFYAIVAAVGIGILVFSYGRAPTGERRIVRNLALLLAAGGIFGGPISMLAMVDDPVRWQFVEEFGESLVYAVISGYVVGLVHVGTDLRIGKDGWGTFRRR